MDGFTATKQWVKDTRERLTAFPALARLFENCFLRTLTTTTEWVPGEDSYVFTGDIPAMWLRDSASQVLHYLPLCQEDADMKDMVRCLIRRQMMYLRIDPYANSFNKTPSNAGHTGDLVKRSPWVWERKYELDSLCFPLHLSALYVEATGDSTVLDGDYLDTVDVILDTMETEQHHDQRSDYSFIRPGAPPDWSLPNEGRGRPVGYTGMVWSGFRPSDDPCQYGYLVPANLFAARVLDSLLELLALMKLDTEKQRKRITALRDEIRRGVETYGIVDHPEYGQIYAYEVDGLGGVNLMDDANIPSLLALPYLRCLPADDPLYLRTRQFVLSHQNPYYFRGTAAQGVGSPHTPPGYIWPMSLIIQATTCTSREEGVRLLRALLETHAGTYYMHESFHSDDPAAFTREWFAWADSLLAGLVVQRLDEMEDWMRDIPPALR